jgi:hypothetical protein
MEAMKWLSAVFNTSSKYWKSVEKSELALNYYQKGSMLKGRFLLWECL